MYCLSLAGCDRSVTQCLVALNLLSLAGDPCRTHHALIPSYYMSRTTIVLDTPSQAALDALTRHYGCSASEAVRRALIQHLDRALGVPEEKRRRRRAALEDLVRLMDGHDWQSELKSLEEEEA